MEKIGWVMAEPSLLFTYTHIEYIPILASLPSLYTLLAHIQQFTTLELSSNTIPFPLL